MKNAVLITGHFPQQKRKGSMLWLSEHLQNLGWHVTIVTVGYSHLSRLKGDARLRALGSPPRQGCTQISPSLTAQFSLPLLHPFNTKYSAINLLLEPASTLFTQHWYRRLRPALSTADLVICESGAPVLLGPIAARYAPNAPRIYRVSDDIRLLNAPACLIRAEAAHGCFTRISTASPHLAARFADHPNVTLDPNGIPRSRAAAPLPTPYGPAPCGKIAVCAGTTQLDIPALLRLAAARPAWQIHVLGRLKTKVPACPNIFWHGEQSFDTTLAHIAHADIGLAPYIDAPGVEYQTTNSNRILLYRHFGLPTLGPDRLMHPALPSIIGYGAPNALERLDVWHKSPEDIPDWSALALRLAQNGVTDPPCDTSTPPATISKSRVKTVPALASSA
ncbi:MAG: GumK N-terminal domain-containing glycosyltransferase [Sulfitobacter sp.]